MATIYTRTGDAGETSLMGGRRVRKDDLRIEAIGDIDETNAAIGVARAELSRVGAGLAQVDEILKDVQSRLFDVGAELAGLAATGRVTAALDQADVQALESAIDAHDSQLAPLRAFILPGGSPASARLHLVRCVCRRAERRIVALSSVDPVRGELLAYINRLSDLLFVLARAVNQSNGVADVLWRQGC